MDATDLANDPVFWNEIEGVDDDAHEEWMLSIVGHLMRREAEVVSKLEQQYEDNQSLGKGRGKGRGRGRGQ